MDKIKKIVDLTLFFLLIFFTGICHRNSLVWKQGYSFKDKPSIDIGDMANNTSKRYELNIEEPAKEALRKEFIDNKLLAYQILQISV